MPSYSELQKSLERLILNDEDFRELEIKIGKLNIFDAVGMSNQEIRHSAFLGFLLNPSANHTLGDVFLKQFFMLITDKIDEDADKEPDNVMSAIDIDIADLSSTVVTTEESGGYGRIDIFIRNDEHEFIVVVENKIFSGESGDQLKRYAKEIQAKFKTYKLYFVFLTPEGDEPTDTADQAVYACLDYAEITEIIERLIAQYESKVSQELLTLMKHYTIMLERNNIIESDISKKYRAIWRKNDAANISYVEVLTLFKGFYDKQKTQTENSK